MMSNIRPCSIRLTKVRKTSGILLSDPSISTTSISCSAQNSGFSDRASNSLQEFNIVSASDIQNKKLCERFSYPFTASNHHRSYPQIHHEIFLSCFIDENKTM